MLEGAELECELVKVSYKMLVSLKLAIAVVVVKIK